MAFLSCYIFSLFNVVKSMTLTKNNIIIMFQWKHQRVGISTPLQMFKEL